MMILRLIHFLCLFVLLLVISAETNVLYNKNILYEGPAFYLIFIASLSLLLLLVTWPVVSNNKFSKIISMTLKLAVIVSVFLLIVVELAIVDFAGMAFGHEVMYHVSKDAVILGLKEYKYILIIFLVIVVLLTWIIISAANLISQRLRWLIFALSLLGFMTLGHLTVIGRLYKSISDYYSQAQIKSMSAEELEKYSYLGIQSIITNKNDIEIKSVNHKNLIVIYLESFSHIFTDSKLYLNLTPNLNKLKQQYQHIYPYISPAGFTMDGLIASMCGFIPDMRMGNNTLASQQGTYSALPCFPDVLQKAGYRQEFFGGAKKQFAGKSAFLLAHGFDRVVGWEDFVDLPEYQTKESHNWWGLHDDDLFARVFDRISELHKQKQPFHTQVLTIGTHLKGFVAPSCELYSEKSHQFINAIHCTDQLLGQFINKLDDAGILDDTVVYITGDHGVFETDLSQELFGKQVADRNLYGVIVDKNPNSSVYMESLYDLAPAVLQSIGVEHNVQFVLGRSHHIKNRNVFTRHSLYKNGEMVEVDYNCDENTSLQQKVMNACSLKAALNVVKAHTQLFSTSDGVILKSISKLKIGFENSFTGIAEVKLDDLDIKSRFKRDGFVIQKHFFERPGLFYLSFNKEKRMAENFILIKADNNASNILKNLKDKFQQEFVIFGIENNENKIVIDDLKQEFSLDCLLDIVCFSKKTNFSFKHHPNNSFVEIVIGSLLEDIDRVD